MSVRTANVNDAPGIVRLVNLAYEVENFFVAGDRTTVDRVREEMAATTGVFLISEDEGGILDGCVHVSIDDGRGHFGMLAVHPGHRRRGLGRDLIARAETYAQTAGAHVMDIHVVNLRTELLAFYERLGYRPTGTDPYVHRPVLQPCHFIRMSKDL